MKKILYWLHAIENTLLVTLFIAILGLSCSQILLRNGFGYSFVWGDACIRVLVLWISLTGAVLASRQKKHIKIDLIQYLVSSKGERVVEIIRAIATAAICLFICFYSIQFIISEYEFAGTAFLQVPVWVCETIIPIGFALIAIHAIASLFEPS